MARTPAPVRPRVKDAKDYERALRREILDPLFRQLKTGLADVSAISQVWLGHFDTFLFQALFATDARCRHRSRRRASTSSNASPSAP